jgi:glycosyltransferase involved in cell wall biosynthesis
MASIMSGILRSAYRKKGEPLNILTFPTHERYETALAATGNNFYAYYKKGMKKWNTIFAPVPKNYTLLPADLDPPLDIDFDLVLCQNKMAQHAVAKLFSRAYHSPLICLEHTLPSPEWPEEHIKELNKMSGDVNVFVGEYNVKQWKCELMNSVVIHHGIDTDMFVPLDIPRRNHLFSVVNDWINRDFFCGFRLWEQVSKDLPVAVVGDTPGLSKPASSTTELVSFYQQSEIFLNTSLVSSLPLALLEAMSCGCAIVSTATSMIPEVITHGVNGLISNNPSQLREYCETLLKNTKLARKLGKAARKTAEEKFSTKRFVKDWNGLFQRAANDMFVKER